MNIIEATDLTNIQKQAIYRLWNAEYPALLAYTSLAEFDVYLAELSAQRHYLLIDGSAIRGWLFLFDRDGQRWFAIIIDSSIHGQGFGTRLLDLAKSVSRSLHGWATDHNRNIKLDGTSYKSPINFYLQNNFAIQPALRLDTEKISAVKIEWHKE